MYVKNIRELVEYIICVFRERRFFFSVKYVFWVLWDKIRGFDYVKNEGYDKLHTSSKQSVVFQATRDLKYLRRILNDLEITKNDSILDLGCGKGFLIKFFSEFQFKKVGGVEISKELCKIAERNLNKEGIRDFEIFNENAMTFNEYDNYNYFYMFNPFPSVVVQEVMKKLKKLVEDGRIVTIIYHNPICHEDIIHGGCFALMAKYKGKSTDYYVYRNKKNKL